MIVYHTPDENSGLVHKFRIIVLILYFETIDFGMLFIIQVFVKFSDLKFPKDLNDGKHSEIESLKIKYQYYNKKCQFETFQKRPVFFEAKSELEYLKYHFSPSKFK